MEKYFVDHAYGWSCLQVCPGSLVMVDLAAALLTQMIDATSVVIGGTMPMTATVSASGEAVVAAGPVPDPGLALGPGDEGTARGLAVVAMKGGTGHHLTPGAVAGLPLQHDLSLGLQYGVVRVLAHGLRHVHVVDLHPAPAPGHAPQVLRETAVPALPARKRAPLLEQTEMKPNPNPLSPSSFFSKAVFPPKDYCLC
ncbi:serine and arginine rich splicing factor 7a isoform X2 [Alosa alosa]|uniref:serine and arginine rich splicing factor 7a isoform X2 n=1 Tax=Alosa alosa TaxID=278164 RepID=UPI0020150DD4|nr:serine and arginine rich splicing factor 7a isoform X2 [Alosa alosa]